MHLRVFAGIALTSLVALAPRVGLAQEDHDIAPRRAVIERDQQSAAFALQLRQSQERRLRSDSKALEELHLEQQRLQQALHQDQLRRLSQPGRAEVPGQLDADRQRFARERQVQALEFQQQRRVPVVEAPGRWTPTLEPPRRSWTPSLERPAPQ